MTEREKMLRGELYDSSDNELEQLRLHARKLARRYNLTDEDQQEVQTKILRELLPATEELPYLQAPVYDYIQIHGEIPETEAEAAIAIPILKAFNVSDMGSYEKYHKIGRAHV